MAAVALAAARVRVVLAAAKDQHRAKGALRAAAKGSALVLAKDRVKAVSGALAVKVGSRALAKGSVADKARGKEWARGALVVVRALAVAKAGRRDKAWALASSAAVKVSKAAKTQ